MKRLFKQKAKAPVIREMAEINKEYSDLLGQLGVYEFKRIAAADE